MAHDVTVGVPKEARFSGEPYATEE